MTSILRGIVFVKAYLIRRDYKVMKGEGQKRACIFLENSIER
ncbi:hypothetical protein RV10_GL001868 [Enterococcus pallens]|nr:hypothetical protein RV10_GL001868 [Enterococcus pallens]